MSYKFHEDGAAPTNGEIFVFGSNLAGVHGAGAAKAAKMYFGAVWGVGKGLTGQSYAIPTKDERIQTRHIKDIVDDINEFINFANDNPNIDFWITRVGCGLAGYQDARIAPLFEGSPPNCSFPDVWEQYL